MKIQKDDKVKIIAGKDKGKVGKVIKIYSTTDRVLVEGINLVTKHIKPGTTKTEGGIVHIEKPVHISNVMYFDEKSNQATKIGYTIVDGKKYRISKKTKDVIGA